MVQQLTGITDADVADAPSFKSMAASLATKFKGCDFAGFNSNHFDIPMLAEEFLRAGIDFDFSSCRLIDAQTIFHKMERRNLAAAYKFYCGRKMEDDFEAHRADQDTEATYRVLMGELDKYSAENQTEPERQLANDMDVLAEFSKNNDNVDFAGRIVWKEVTGPDGKPVMGADKGTIVQRGQSIGMKKALAKIAELVASEVKDAAGKRLMITHCNAPKRAEILKDMILARTSFKETIILDTAGISSMYANDGGVIVAV